MSEAFPMPLGSESTLGLAGPNGTPLIAELPAPADPAGGVSCAKACAGTIRLPSAKARTSAELRDIQGLSGGCIFNDDVGRAFPHDNTLMAAITVYGFVVLFQPARVIVRSIGKPGLPKLVVLGHGPMSDLSPFSGG
jgi:hypothetical protein